MKTSCPYDGTECKKEKSILVEMYTNENEPNKFLCCTDCLKTKIPNQLIIDGAQKELKDKKCPNCQINILEILKTSKIGCPLCYSFFYKEIKVLVQSCQRFNEENLGKYPEGIHHKSALVACLLQDLENYYDNPEIINDLKEYLKNY